MKKTILAILLLAASGVCGYARDVRVLLKDGVERKGELTVTNEDSLFIKFKNGVVRKFGYANIDSVLDADTGQDILPSLIAESKAAAAKAAEAEPVPAVKAPAAEPAPAPAPAAVKTPEPAPAPEKAAPAAEKAPEPEKAPAPKKAQPVKRASDSFISRTSAQKALPDNVMAWMAQRYDAKTMLGFKWEHPEKVRTQYAFEKNNYMPRAGVLAPAGARRGPSGRLEIVPFAEFFDSDAFDVTTNSYFEARYAKNSPGAAWNAGYISYSETRDDFIFESSAAGFTDGDKYKKTDASVVYASLVLALPIPHFTYYGCVGPAFVSYDYSESGSATTFPFGPGLPTTQVFNARKSGTAFTWLAGLGFSLRADSGFGIFGEFKHIAGTGAYLGADILGAGVSIGF